VLDIVEFPVLERVPEGFQRENWRLQPDGRWRITGRATCTDLEKYVDRRPGLWIDGYRSNPGGHNRIPLEKTEELITSLRLLSAESVTLVVYRKSNGRRYVDACFRHAGQYYRLRVTDPVYEERYMARRDGEYRLGGCYLTISLGEKFRDEDTGMDYCYKLVAAVIERDKVQN
jgi:hypothetical protein